MTYRIVKRIRKPAAPPSRRHMDRKKELNKKACRGKASESEN